MRRLIETPDEQPERPDGYVGRKLMVARRGHGLSLEEVGQDLKIHVHHLEAIERGHFDALPNPLWARGLLIRYANRLDLEGEELADRFFPLQRPHRPIRFLRRRWRWLVALGALVAIVMMAPAALIFAPDNGFAGRIRDSLHDLVPGTVLGSEPQRIAVLGTGEAGFAGAGNILAVEIGQSAYEVLSIEEGTRANVPGYGTRSIGEAAALGGPDLTRKAVAQLTGAETQHYVRIGPEGIREITDQVGGVQLDVPYRIAGKASIGGPQITLRPGMQTLDGDEMLVYLQGQDLSSETELADRQKEVVSAMFEQALGPRSLVSHPTTVSSLLERTETNMTPLEAAQLAVRLHAVRGADAIKEFGATPGREGAAAQP
jgi:LCP family protein required for cell wall assembly